jgi:Skp family chaperone for outer membrane proteins
MAARRKLDEEKAAMQRTLDFKRRELEGLREELASPRRAGMSPEVRREKFERFEDMRRAAARLADDFRNDLDNSERQFLAHARAEIAALVEQLGAQRGYFLIFEQKGSRH